MYPVLHEFELFGRAFALHGYGLMIGLGFLAWLHVVGREAARLGQEKLFERRYGVALALAAAVFVGGKLAFWLTQGAEASRDAGEGFVFYGSMLASLPVLWWVTRRLGVPALLALDVFVLPGPLTHAFGRVGCFLSGCCFGHACELPWGVTFTQGNGLNGVPLHPVQLYEAGGLAALFLLLYLVVRPRKRFDGQILFTYLIGYSVLRAVTESFRGDPDRKFLFTSAQVEPGQPPAGLSTSTAISALVAAAAVALLVWLRRTGRLSALTRPPADR